MSLQEMFAAIGCRAHPRGKESDWWRRQVSNPSTWQVETGETPHLFGVETPRPRIEAARIVDMTSSNSWAEFAGVFCQTRAAFLNHKDAKVELKKPMPEDAREAIGHGIRAKRSKSGAVTVDLQVAEAGHAALQ